MSKDSKECNKFSGLYYVAIDRHNKIIASGSNPEEVYLKAVIKGETCPYITEAYITDNNNQFIRKMKLRKIWQTGQKNN